MKKLLLFFACFTLHELDAMSSKMRQAATYIFEYGKLREEIKTLPKPGLLFALWHIGANTHFSYTAGKEDGEQGLREIRDTHILSTAFTASAELARYAGGYRPFVYAFAQLGIYGIGYTKSLLKKNVIEKVDPEYFRHNNYDLQQNSHNKGGSI